MFRPEEFDADPDFYADLSEDVRSECSKFGVVKRVVIYDRHPEGVVGVRFTERPAADACIAVRVW
jgi:HIV Tat-specific factor 1